MSDVKKSFDKGNNEEMLKKKQTNSIFMIILFAGALLAMAVHFFPSQKAAYVVCPWIYIPCFLYVSRHMETKIQWLLWFLFWTGSFVVRYWGIVSLISIHISIALAFAGAMVYSIPYVVDHFTYQKGSKMVSWLLFPCMSAAVDYIMELTRMGSLFSVAQTQFDNKPFLQISALAGSKGICFVLTLFASLLVFHIKNVKRIALCVLAIFLLHLCGIARIRTHEPLIDASGKLTVGWSAEPIAASLDDSFFSESVDGSLERNIIHLKAAMDKAKQKDVKLLCFPEECFFVYYENYDSFVQEAQQLAKEYQMHLLLSVEADDAEDEDILGVNKCLLINDQGEILEDYVKAKLIPVIEKQYYYSGDGVLPNANIQLGDMDITLSYGICFDGDFASYLYNISDDTNLYIDVSWDWDEVAEQHYRMIGLRAVENGLSVVKPTIDGYTTVTDYLGYLHSKTHTDEKGYTDVCLVEIPIAVCPTFYHKFGHYIDALYIAGVIILIMVFFMRRRKSGKEKAVNKVW